MLEGCRKTGTPAIVVGAHKGRAGMEGSLAVSYKLKHDLTMWSCSQAPILPSEIERREV